MNSVLDVCCNVNYLLAYSPRKFELRSYLAFDTFLYEFDFGLCSFWVSFTVCGMGQGRRVNKLSTGLMF